MSSVQDVAYLAGLCSPGRRLPMRAKKLGEMFPTLDERTQEHIRRLMIKEDVQLGMALRACQAAPSNILGANRIIDTLIVIFGKAEAIHILQEVNYYQRLLACAQRLSHPKKNRLGLAQELCEHLAGLFGLTSELEALFEDIRGRLGNRPMMTPNHVAVCV